MFIIDRFVSIHAPARGATQALSCQLAPPSVSIHAPARGATSARERPGLAAGFNPRARTGRDTSQLLLKPKYLQFQSTRPHGARRAAERLPCFERVSIHAPARGATLMMPVTITAWLFQSTRPHGARRGQIHLSANEQVSIHAPARGATYRGFLSASWPGVSIHAPARGATALEMLFLWP